MAPNAKPIIINHKHMSASDNQRNYLLSLLHSTVEESLDDSVEDKGKEAGEIIREVCEKISPQDASILIDWAKTDKQIALNQLNLLK